MDHVDRRRQEVISVDQPVAADATRRPQAEASFFRIAALGLLAALLIRLVLLPGNGFPFDLDQFVLWTHQLTWTPVGEAYRLSFPYPPVMVYVLAALGALDPAFRTAVAGGSAAIDIAIKLPATGADLGIAACVAYALRQRPRQALLGALAILLNPALWYVSAWWGQFDSLYMLPALVAYLVAISGRPLPAAIALAISMMTKPEALPLIVPFAAWSLARHGLRTSLMAILTMAATITVLWLPFLATGGLPDYLSGTSALVQSTPFEVISFQAWNPWWMVQLITGVQSRLVTGAVISITGMSANTVLFGPVTLAMIGFVLAGIGELLVFFAVLRRPSSRGLALGLALSTLVAFLLLPAMHERYSLAAIVFLAPLLAEARIRRIWIALSIVISINVIAAIPASTAVALLLPSTGIIGLAGSLAMTALTAGCLVLLFRGPAEPAADAPPAVGHDAVRA